MDLWWVCLLESWLADSQTLFSRVKIVKILAQFSFKCQQLASMFVRCCTCACYNFYAWKPWLNNVIKGFCNAWTQKELFIPAMQLKNCALSAAFCFSFGSVVNSCGWTRWTVCLPCASAQDLIVSALMVALHAFGALIWIHRQAKKRLEPPYQMIMWEMTSHKFAAPFFGSLDY